FAFSARTEATASRNGLDADRAYFQARTGVHRAIALLSWAGTDNVLGQEITGGEGDVSYDARVVAEGGKIDINFVTEEVLKEVLRKGGLPEGEAERVGDAILDWRDEDDRPRENGAEEGYYASLPEPVKPRNGKFAGAWELRHVRGVDPEFFDRFLSAVFTAEGGGPGVNVNLTPVEVLEALPGFTPELAARVDSRRRSLPFRSAADVAAFLAGEGVKPPSIPLFSTARASRAYTITSAGRAGGEIVRSVRCTIELRGGGNPYKIKRWEDHVASREENR
ncbi:MAG TPA: type II secretion system protein GspK, partial [Candidatus Aquicultoraceae bacterium]|nr:type II secretion system protein GspK [Candidatus Aquicultoraceae bacterium]